MEEYREELKVSNRIIAFCSFVLAAFCFVMAAAEAGVFHITPAGGDAHWASMWRGFICGAAVGVLGMLVVCLVRNIRALKDEKALKKLYIKEHDERQIQIWTSARAAALEAFLLLGLVAIIVAGYFNMTVAVTILACVVAASLIGFGFKVYYSRRY